MCTSCRTAGALLQSLPGAEPLLDAHGASRLVLYRKDRFECTAGAELLREHRLKPESPSRRVVAICCNSAMFFEFTQGHWVSIFGQSWRPSEMPPAELRMMTMDLPEGTALPGNIPNVKRQNFAFFRKLIGAWIAMRFRTPKIEFVKGVLDVPQG